MNANAPLFPSLPLPSTDKSYEGSATYCSSSFLPFLPPRSPLLDEVVGGPSLRPWALREAVLKYYGTGHAILFNDRDTVPFEVECCAHIG